MQTQNLSWRDCGLPPPVARRRVMQPDRGNYFKEGRHVGLDLNGLLMEGLLRFCAS